MWVVRRLARFQDYRMFDLPIRFDSTAIGFLPVYATREEAVAAHPRDPDPVEIIELPGGRW